MDVNENDISTELEKNVENFENLPGIKKLEFLKIIIEKMENGEIVINDYTVYASDIGIEDGFICCRHILKLLTKYQ